MTGSHPTSGSGGMGSPVWNYVDSEWGRGGCQKEIQGVLFITQKGINSREAKPTPIHSFGPFRTTDRIFQRAEFDKMRDKTV